MYKAIYQVIDGVLFHHREVDLHSSRLHGAIDEALDHIHGSGERVAGHLRIVNGHGYEAALIYESELVEF